MSARVLKMTRNSVGHASVVPAAPAFGHIRGGRMARSMSRRREVFLCGGVLPADYAVDSLACCARIEDAQFMPRACCRSKNNQPSPAKGDRTRFEFHSLGRACLVSRDLAGKRTVSVSAKAVFCRNRSRVREGKRRMRSSGRRFIASPGGADVFPSVVDGFTGEVRGHGALGRRRLERFVRRLKEEHL